MRLPLGSVPQAVQQAVGGVGDPRDPVHLSGHLLHHPRVLLHALVPQVVMVERAELQQEARGEDQAAEGEHMARLPDPVPQQPHRRRS